MKHLKSYNLFELHSDTYKSARRIAIQKGRSSDSIKGLTDKVLDVSGYKSYLDYAKKFEESHQYNWGYVQCFEYLVEEFDPSFYIEFIYTKGEIKLVEKTLWIFLDRKTQEVMIETEDDFEEPVGIEDLNHFKNILNSFR